MTLVSLFCAVQDAAAKVYRFFSSPDSLHAAFWPHSPSDTSSRQPAATQAAAAVLHPPIQAAVRASCTGHSPIATLSTQGSQPDSATEQGKVQDPGQQGPDQPAASQASAPRPTTPGSPQMPQDSSPATATQPPSAHPSTAQSPVAQPPSTVKQQKGSRRHRSSYHEEFDISAAMQVCLITGACVYFMWCMGLFEDQMCPLFEPQSNPSEALSPVRQQAQGALVQLGNSQVNRTLQARNPQPLHLQPFAQVCLLQACKRCPVA